jgi:hypothetical protein
MHILVAALNWGMGHASRTVPLVRALQSAGVKVTLASDGVAADLLRAEFPDLEVYELPSYKVSYPTGNIYLNVLRSALNIFRAIMAESRWLKNFIKTHDIDATISDNRYGIRSHKVPAVLITHQLTLYGNWPWANRIGEFFIRIFIRRFSEVWVPDWEGDKSLTGGMAAWRYTQPPLYYVGPLSRFDSKMIKGETNYDIAVILSGPEPQRSHFELMIRQQLCGMGGRYILVRGTREAVPSDWVRCEHVEERDLLAIDDLQAVVRQSRMQISRSGYSTVMDLVYSGIPALMVPTPGQFEQEFLCEYLLGKGPWLFQTQDTLDIPAAWQQFLGGLPPLVGHPSGEEADLIVGSFLERLVKEVS